MANVIWHSGSSLFLLALLLCQWSCSYWCHVYSLLVCGYCFGHSIVLGSPCSIIPLQPNGRHYSLWNWIRTCILWGGLCTTSKMVGLWFPDIGGEYYNLPWSRRHLVEGYWLVVRQNVIKFADTELRRISHLT